MEFSLNDEQRRLRDVAHDFAATRIRPVAAELDGRADPAATYPKELVSEASALGLRTLTLPQSVGGLEADSVTEAVVLEELCWGDPGFGMTLAHPWREGRMLFDFGTDAQRRRFLPSLMADPDFVTSLALTEEHAGSDHALPFTDTLEAGPQTTARMEGDRWVINGRKRWITSGNVSRLLIVFARTDRSVHWRDGISAFLVPGGTPGLATGRVEDKLGLRLNQNAELIFTDCAVPADHLLGEVNGGARILAAVAAGSKWKEAVKCLGVGRAALDAARDWTQNRVQGGVALTEHQAVGNSLAEMAMELEAVRSLVWRAAWAADHDPATAGQLSTMAKIFAARVAVRVAVRSLELHGAYGIRRGEAAERNARNALTMLHATGGNDALLSHLHGIL